jgi:predicted  nucleic acid-binding Zn-ribbon protein
MSTDTQPPPAAIPSDLIEAIQSFPPQRVVEHCGQKLSVGALEMYADCPNCGTRIKLRSFGATTELEDVFDAVLEWMTDPAARRSAELRLQAIEDDL